MVNAWENIAGVRANAENYFARTVGCSHRIHGSAPLLGSRAAPGPGNIAPDFTLTSQEENSVSLKDYRGKWVILYFYPKDQTPGCTREAHNFQVDQSK